MLRYALSLYLDACEMVQNKAMTLNDFDNASYELQNRFFNVQAKFRGPELVNDNFLQSQLNMIKRTVLGFTML